MGRGEGGCEGGMEGLGRRRPAARSGDEPRPPGPRGARVALLPGAPPPRPPLGPSFLPGPRCAPPAFPPLPPPSLPPFLPRRFLPLLMPPGGLLAPRPPQAGRPPFRASPRARLASRPAPHGPCSSRLPCLLLTPASPKSPSQRLFVGQPGSPRGVWGLLWTTEGSARSL